MSMTVRKPGRPAPDGPVPAEKPRGVTWRAVAIAFVLTPLNSLWIVHSEVIQYAGHPTTVSLFFNVIFCLAVLVAINALLARWAPRYRFSQGELLTIYILLSLATAMVGHDMYQVLISVIAQPFWYAEVAPERRWHELFTADLPPWLVVTDTEILRDYFHGTNHWSGFYRAAYIMGWLRPVLVWTGFTMILLFTMLCLSVLLRKQWTERERLTFPIIELPLRMTDESFKLFKSPAFWIAVALAGMVDLINTLHLNIPTIPGLPTRQYSLNQFITAWPWRAMGPAPLQFLPFIIGIGFLLPVDLSFSCWFFFWYWKAQQILTARYGWNDGRPDFPYTIEQSFGAFIGVCVLVVWLARPYLKEVWRTACGQASEVSDDDEPISYRFALIGLGAGLLAFAAFAYAGGLRSLPLLFLFVLIYFALAVAVSRMRAEMGTPAHDLHHGGPDQILPRLLGTPGMEKSTLIWFSLSWGYNRAYRSHPMPHYLEGFRLAHLARIERRRLFFAMLFFGLWGSLCAFWALLHTYYQVGASTGKVMGPAVSFGQEAWNQLARWLTAPKDVEPLSKWFALGGLGFSLFLTAMRARYTWWAFHPVGLAVSSSWAMRYMWLSLFIAWLCKVAILRAGGLNLYRRALPFFLGLIFGEFVIGELLNLIGLLFRLQIYRFWG